jgi:hypothetical protein
MGFWLGSGQDGLDLIMVVVLDMMASETWCVSSKGLRKVVCQPLVVWLCVDPRSFVPFNELILGWEVRPNSHSN